MKKMKVFFVAAALVLVTAGVFAGKSKFAGEYVLAYLSGTTYTPIVNAGSTNIQIQTPLSFTGTTNATINGEPLYYYNFTALTGKALFF
jgi:hypothetical protein